MSDTYDHISEMSNEQYAWYCREVSISSELSKWKKLYDEKVFVREVLFEKYNPNLPDDNAYDDDCLILNIR